MVLTTDLTTDLTTAHCFTAYTYAKFISVQTVLTTSPAEAAQIIKNGGIVAFPTETVYGLGANVFDEKAIAKIFIAKRRPNDNPLIAHVSSLEQVETLASEINQTAREFIDAFFPGPLTLVLPKADDVPLIATAGLDTVGVRMPRNEIAQRFLRECETSLVAPSANLSGKPSPTRWEAVYEDLNGRIDCILQGETTEIGLESTVVDCTGAVPIILRQGAVTLEDLRELVPETKDSVGFEGSAPKSPGLKHRHYSPSAKVILVSDVPSFEFENSRAAFIGITKPQVEFDSIKICESVEDYGRSLFNFFRACDRAGIDRIYCEQVSRTGLGAAVMDRIERASSLI